MNVWMKKGGHTERFRQVVTIRAVENVRKSLKNNKTGTKKMFRSREEIEEFWERRGGKVDNQDWFRKGGATGVLYIPSTEGEVLKREVERVLAREVGPTVGPDSRVLEISLERNICPINLAPREE